MLRPRPGEDKLTALARSRECERLALLLVLAWLEDDEEQRWWYRESVRQLGGLTEASFALADTTARIFADSYRRPEAREEARNALTRMVARRTT